MYPMCSLSYIQLLHPLGATSPIAKFLANNKEGGMHHICIEVKHSFVGVFIPWP